MSKLTLWTIIVTFAASSAVRFASALVCYDCVTGMPSRTGKVACDGYEENWQTCYVQEGVGSCVLMEFENEIVRSCFEGSPHKDCTNTTSFDICYCDSDLCNRDRAAAAKTASSTELQWFDLSHFRCPFSFCGDGSPRKPTPGPKLPFDLLRELQQRPINVQLHFNYCDAKSVMVSMILIMSLLLCLKILFYVLQKLQ